MASDGSGELVKRTFVITRFDPDKDQVPKTQSYEVACRPEWKVLEIGPAADALLLTQHDDSGDTSLERAEWLTVAGGKLVEQFSYRSGVEGGMYVAEVEYEIGREPEHGRYPIVFAVKRVDEEQQDPDTVTAERDSCRWDAATGRYACEKDLLP